MASGIVIPNVGLSGYGDVQLYDYNFQGTIINVFQYRIIKNVFEFGGTCRINATARTGQNPGIYFFIPNNRKSVNEFQINCGVCLSPSAVGRNGEMCNIVCYPSSLNKINITTTETQLNMPTGMNIFSIPMIQIALQPL